MRTTHEAVVGDARSMDAVADGSVELVVTSPPYPMIEMWDGTFADLDDEVAACLDRDDGDAAFDRMHSILDAVWDEVGRVLVDGGLACINVGDATRTLDGRFRLYPNHVRVADAFRDRGFDALPPVLWRKPTNSATKFMGSGMLPPNAYVTLEHEYVLVFRKGDPRSFDPGDDRRYGSAYFWEERNEWFSDVWEVRGERQTLDADARERSGAFPFEIPYRLINMYSVRDDTVLDPFWGTGTTSLAAVAAGRNSIGYEIEPDLGGIFDDRIDEIEALTRELNRDRLRRHREFVRQRRAEGNDPGYEAVHYDVPVVTRQEREIRFYDVADVEGGDGCYAVTHDPVEAVPEPDGSRTDASSPDWPGPDASGPE